MATPNRKVLDISHWNTVSDWAAVKNAGVIGIIHKATEGTSYKDPNYDGARKAAQSVGLMWGAYHFANGSDPKKQADFFLGVADLDNNFLYALDWEDDPGGDTMTGGQARTFIEHLEKNIGEKRTVIYSGNTAKEALGSYKDTFFGARRLWLAQYSTDPKPQVSWDDWWLWQYSDGQNGPQPHGCPGVSGDVDTNSYDGNDHQLRIEWPNGKIAPVPPPVPVPAVAAVNMKLAATGNVVVTINDIVVWPPHRRNPRQG
jgi:lysozyme